MFVRCYSRTYFTPHPGDNWRRCTYARRVDDRELSGFATIRYVTRTSYFLTLSSALVCNNILYISTCFFFMHIPQQGIFTSYCVFDIAPQRSLQNGSRILNLWQSKLLSRDKYPPFQTNDCEIFATKKIHEFSCWWGNSEFFSFQFFLSLYFTAAPKIWYASIFIKISTLALPSKFRFIHHTTIRNNKRVILIE